MWQVGGWPAALFGLIGMVASAEYAGDPFVYARWGLADIVFFIMFGVVAVVGIYYIEAIAVAGPAASPAAVLRGLPLSVYLIGLPVGALITNVLLIDDMRDREPDRDKGWRTGTVVFGRGFTRAKYVVLSIFAYGSLLWFWLGLNLSMWVLLPLLTLPVALAIGRKVWTAKDMRELVPMTPRATFLSLAFGILLGIGIAVSS